MTTELRETEQKKYEGSAGTILPTLEDLPGVATVSEPEPETLVADYYDTDDLRLLVAGVTLRRREGGPDEGWQLKLPDDTDVSQHPAVSGDPVPAELARHILVHTRGGTLRPVARLETRRRRTTLRDAAGKSLAEIRTDDVAAQTLGASTTLSRWNEVEVALTGGSHKLMRATSSRLRNSGLRPTERWAPLEHALAVDPEVSAAYRDRATRKPGRQAPAGDVVLAYVGAQATRLKALDPAVRRDEPDAVHQMRVTTRRLRAALQAFPMIVPKPSTAHLREELRWLGHVLGAARDVEVLDAHFRDELEATPEELVIGPAKARATAHFSRLEAVARTALADAMDSPRYFALLDELDELLAAPPLTAVATARAADVLPKAVDRAYRRSRRRGRRASRMQRGPAQDAMLHEARKAARRARYAAEVTRPVAGKDARRFAKKMKGIQSGLGDHHDAVTARAMAREIGVQAHLAGENAFTFGMLNERAHHDAADRKARARMAWKAAHRRKVRKWLK